MSLLLFRTDSTNLFDNKFPINDPAQPRMMRLEAVLVDKNWRTFGSLDMLVRPDGWVPNAGAAATHGITPRQCDLYGVRAHAVLACFMDMVRAATEIAAFGLDFHSAIIKRELSLLGGLPEAWVRGGMQRTCVQRTASAKWNNGRTMNIDAAFNGAVAASPDFVGSAKIEDKMEKTIFVLKELRRG